MNDVEVLSQIGKSKCQMMKDEPWRFFTRAVLAGLYLGIAAIISYTLGALFSDNTAVSKVAVAGSFGIGLVAIIFLGAELFTGNCYVTMMPVLNGELKIRDIIPAWVTCYIGNCLGIGLICWLFIMGGSQTSILKPYLQSLIDAKLNFDVLQLIIRGILCNFIVCIAAYAGVKIKGDTARLIVIMVMVMAFVLPDFEHCIANAGIFTMGVSLLGNSIHIAMIPLHMLLSTIGNIIGGTSLAILLYIIFK